MLTIEFKDKQKLLLNVRLKRTKLNEETSHL